LEELSRSILRPSTRAKKDADTHTLAKDLESRFGFTEGQAYVEAIKITELREINEGITEVWTAIQNLPKF
jgi:hypothetical protein